MESVHLQIRITTDDEMNFKELCDRAVVWGYAQEGSLEGFLPDPVNFHIYLETYLKPQKALSLEYLSDLVKTQHIFKSFNIPKAMLQKARLYDKNAVKQCKLDGIAKLKFLLPEKPTDLQIRECILKYYHEHDKPFHRENMKASKADEVKEWLMNEFPTVAEEVENKAVAITESEKKHSALWTFEGKEVKIKIDVDGKEWFCGRDVCKILGYENPKQALKERVKKDYKISLANIMVGRGKLPTSMSYNDGKSVYISKPGVYQLIFLKNFKPSWQ